MPSAGSIVMFPSTVFGLAEALAEAAPVGVAAEDGADADEALAPEAEAAADAADGPAAEAEDGVVAPKDREAAAAGTERADED